MTVGDQIVWIVRWPRSTVNLVRWAIYFTPFSNLYGMRTITRNTKLGTLIALNQEVEKALDGTDVDVNDVADHAGTLGPDYADRPGEYKYGINATDAESGKEIGTDDPVLIVRD